MAEEGAHRGHAARDRRRGEACGAQLREPPLEVVGGRFRRRAAEPVAERAQVTAVGLDGLAAPAERRAGRGIRPLRDRTQPGRPAASPSRRSFFAPGVRTPARNSRCERRRADGGGGEALRRRRGGARAGGCPLPDRRSAFPGQGGPPAARRTPGLRSATSGPRKSRSRRKRARTLAPRTPSPPAAGLLRRARSRRGAAPRTSRASRASGCRRPSRRTSGRRHCTRGEGRCRRRPRRTRSGGRA